MAFKFRTQGLAIKKISSYSRKIKIAKSATLKLFCMFWPPVSHLTWKIIPIPKLFQTPPRSMCDFLCPIQIVIGKMVVWTAFLICNQLCRQLSWLMAVTLNDSWRLCGNFTPLIKGTVSHVAHAHDGTRPFEKVWKRYVNHVIFGKGAIQWFSYNLVFIVGRWKK